MIQMPLEMIIEKITQASGLSAEEINTKIKEKMDQLSGLISKEGAAHIIANELNVKLFDMSKKVKIKELLPGMRDLNVAGKVTQVWEVREFQTGERSGKVGTFLLGDETGQIRVVMWNDMADNLAKLAPDLIVRVENIMVRDNQGRTEIHCNDRSKLVLSPDDENVGEVSTSAPKTQVSKKKIKELTEQDSNVSLLGTVVQVFDPRFFDRNRKRSEAGEEIMPDWSYVLNLFLDDGSDNIRVVCFGDTVEQLTKMTKDALMPLKDSPGAFEDAKHELLGQIIRFTGRVTKNQMFDRLEFIANSVERDLDPEKELAALQKETPVVAATETTGS